MNTNETRKCIIPGCKYQATFCFPKYMHDKDEWIRKIEGHMGEGWVPDSFKSLCINHFRDEDISERSSTGLLILRLSAKPCFFPWTKEKPNGSRYNEEKITKQISEPITKKTIAVEAVKDAFEVLKGVKKIKRLQVDKSRKYCIRKNRSERSSMFSVSLCLEQLRHALLTHRWDVVCNLLPHLFNERRSPHYIWQVALQIFCYHPGSNSEQLVQFLQICLEVPNIPAAKLEEIFCSTQSYKGAAGNQINFMKTGDIDETIETWCNTIRTKGGCQ